MSNEIEKWLDQDDGAPENWVREIDNHAVEIEMMYGRLDFYVDGPQSTRIEFNMDLGLAIEMRDAINENIKFMEGQTNGREA